MIKVRYVALIEVEDYVPDDYAVLPWPTITERLRGKWVAGAIAEHVRDIFCDPHIKVTAQLVDVVELEKDRQIDGKTEG